MKKTISFCLILLMLNSLFPAEASGTGAKLSRQNLRVDGKVVACEKYNIGGNNYFKLRDIALMLNGTGSQFSVGWDPVRKEVSIVTGEAYVPNGSEMDLSGGDKSASAVPSSQTILLNGEACSDLAAYNIGNNNFFKLRDLGDALGFFVDYDKPSNTAVIISRQAFTPAEYLTEENTYRNNSGYSSRTVYTYNEEGRMLSQVTENGQNSWSYTYSYDELGRMTEQTYRSSYVNEEETSVYGSTTVYAYDRWGLPASETETATGDSVNTVAYEYDEQGRLIRRTDTSNAGTDETLYEYDGQGNLVKETYASEDGYGYTTETVYDQEGNCIQERGLLADGTVSYENVYTYQNGLLLKNVYIGSGDYISVTSCEYDGEGRVVHQRINSPYGQTDTYSEYDEAGNVIRSEYTDGGIRNVTTYEYNERGQELRSETVREDGSRDIFVSVYDEEGNLLSRTGEESGVLSEQICTYDREARKKTSAITVTYPKAERIFFYEEGRLLGVGDDYTLYPCYEPANAAEETLTWTSSDPAVAAVSDSGVIHALAEGEAKITAASESGLSAEYTVTVAKKFTLTLEPASITVKKGYSKMLLCSVSVAGNPASYSFFLSGGDSRIATLTWDAEWNEGANSINLYVSGVAAGDTRVSISVTQNNEFAGELAELAIHVTD